MIPSFSWWNPQLNWREEFMGGVVGAVLVIPQGVTFAYLSGVPPEHGIYCSIFVTILASLFGNSIMMSGPNTATSILIGLSVLPLAGRGSPLFIDYVMILSLMVGLFQLMVWLLRGARIFHYITPTTISGITMGVGVLIMFSALDGILGIASIQSSFFFEKLWMIAMEWGELVNPYAAIVGAITIASGFLAQKKWPRYYLFISIIVGAVVGLVIDGIWPQHITEMEFLGRLDIELFSFAVPKLHSEYLMIALQLVPSAIGIAFLSLAQSLVIARDLKIKRDPELNLNKEVFALGFANTLAPFFLAFAGSGSFNRTQVNEEMGVKTPLAGLLTGVIVIVIIALLGSFFRSLPMAVIAGVLFIVGYRMIKWGKIVALSKDRAELISFSIVLGTVLFLGLMPAILLAVALSLFKHLKPADH